MLKLVIMLNNFLTTYRAIPFFRPLINPQERQQHLSTVNLQISSVNTLSVGTLFLTILIVFPNSASFNLLLKQLSLSKLLFWTTQNTLSRDFYRIFQNYIGNLFSMGAISISYSLLSLKLKEVINTHALLCSLSKLKIKQL